MRRARLEELLRASLPSARLESQRALATSGAARRVRANDRIATQGEPIPVLLVVEGFAAFRRTTVDGQPLITGIARPGEMYGMIGIAGSIAAADLVALTDCVVVSWPGVSVRRLIGDDPGLALDVLDCLASLLGVITQRLDGFLHQDARRRVIRVLSRYRDLIFEDPPVVTRAHLPGLVGTSREMTSRVLRALERDGAIARVGRSRLRLLDASALETDGDEGTGRGL